MITVECIRYGWIRDEEEQAFHTREAAASYARNMLNNHYRVWINNAEVTRGDYEQSAARSDVAHQRLVRAAVLTNGLKGQSIRDEKVIITRSKGMLEVTHKTEFVEVVINDLDKPEAV